MKNYIIFNIMLTGAYLSIFSIYGAATSSSERQDSPRERMSDGEMYGKSGRQLSDKTQDFWERLENKVKDADRNGILLISPAFIQYLSADQVMLDISKEFEVQDFNELFQTAEFFNAKPPIFAAIAHVLLEKYKDNLLAQDLKKVSAIGKRALVKQLFLTREEKEIPILWRVPKNCSLQELARFNKGIEVISRKYMNINGPAPSSYGCPDRDIKTFLSDLHGIADIKGIQEIRNLYISNLAEQNKALDVSPFVGLTRLKELSINSHNGFRILDKRLLQGLHALTRLTICIDILATVEADAFDDVHNLEYLSINNRSGCVSFAPGAFSKLQKLKKLDVLPVPEERAGIKKEVESVTGCDNVVHWAFIEYTDFL